MFTKINNLQTLSFANEVGGCVDVFSWFIAASGKRRRDITKLDKRAGSFLSGL